MFFQSNHLSVKTDDIPCFYIICRAVPASELVRDSGGDSSQRQQATWSLATFVRLHRSLRSLVLQRSASLHSPCLHAPLTGSLTHFGHSLVGRWNFMNMCSRCERVSQEQTRFSSSLETRPQRSFTHATFSTVVHKPGLSSFPLPLSSPFQSTLPSPLTPPHYFTLRPAHSFTA